MTRPLPIDGVGARWFSLFGLDVIGTWITYAEMRQPAELEIKSHCDDIYTRHQLPQICRRQVRYWPA